LKSKLFEGTSFSFLLKEYESPFDFIEEDEAPNEM